MSRSFDETFGAARRPTGAASSVQRRGQGQSRNQQDDFVPAEFWMNVGKEITVPAQDGEGMVPFFLSLPGRGIALDSLKLPNEASNSMMAQGQLNLWKQVMAKAGELEEGETVTVKLDVQIRRVAKTTSVNNEENPFVAQLAL